MRKFELTMVGMSLLALAGCASSGNAWHKAGATADQWAIDRADCRSYARHEADEEYRAAGAGGTSGGISDASDFAALMGAHDARRNAQAIYERCLRRKGYSRTMPATTSGKSA